MELEFVYSKVYNDNLNRHKNSRKTWEEIVALGKKFEAEQEENIKKVINEIPKVTGTSWEEKSITAYIVHWNGPSFSHPLTLKAREDSLLMLVILAHELLHHHAGPAVNAQENEEKINRQVEKVFEGIGLRVSEQLQTIQEYHNERFG